MCGCLMTRTRTHAYPACGSTRAVHMPHAPHCMQTNDTRAYATLTHGACTCTDLQQDLPHLPLFSPLTKPVPQLLLDRLKRLHPAIAESDSSNANNNSNSTLDTNNPQACVRRTQQHLEALLQTIQEQGVNQRGERRGEINRREATIL